MKHSNYFILAAMSSAYLGSFVAGLLGTWSWSLVTWLLSMALVIVAIMELDKKRDMTARAMTGSWALALVFGTTAHVSVTWSMVLFLPVLVTMGAWAFYIRREINKALISHSSNVL